METQKKRYGGWKKKVHTCTHLSNRYTPSHSYLFLFPRALSFFFLDRESNAWAIYYGVQRLKSHASRVRLSLALALSLMFVCLFV